MRIIPLGGDIRLLARVMSLARGYWLLILVFFLVSLLATPLTLLSPIPLAIVANALVGKEALPGLLSTIAPDALESSETRLIALAAVLFVLVALLRQTQELARMLLYTFIGERLTLRFRSRLFAQVQRMSLTYHDNQGTADSVYRIQYDATAIQSLAIEGVIPFATSSITLVAMLYVIFAIDSELAIAALAAAPVMLVLTRIYQTRLRKRARSVKRLESSAMEIIQEVLGSLRVVKAFGQEEREGERFYGRAEDGVQSRVGLSAMEGLFGLLIGVTTAVVGAIVLYIGALHVQSGVLTLGELLLVMGYLSQLYEPLKSASKRVGKMQSSLASAERAFDLLDQAPDVQERLGARPLKRARGEIKFRGVSFGYNSDTRVLHDIWCQLQPGQRLGVYGVTGAGKTTLISLLTRLYDPNEGEILLDGVDIREYKVADLRDQFAVVLQEPVLFSTTIAENIAYARPGATLEEVVEAATAANAHDFISSLPDGYDTIVGERGMRLSGGERQRVGLARAFLKDAPILVLDEPTSAVDHQAEAAILAAMRRLMAGRTTIMIAHRLSTLARCDRWLELLPGGKTRVTSGPPPGTSRRGARRPAALEPHHPAARAWSQLGRNLSDIRAVVPVERRRESSVNLRKSPVYRLEGAGERGSDVIAKKCRRDDGLLESTVYERVLTRLSVPYPRLLGMGGDDDEAFCWLFLEDAGNEVYSPLLPKHRVTAGRWLGALHASTTSLPSDVPLPDRGPAHYLRHLQLARDTILENLNNPALDRRQRHQLRGIILTCDFVESNWTSVDEFCRDMPTTLVHGDFVGKNVRMRSGATGIEVLPFDWEHAGRGVPAVDLAQAAFSSTTFLANPDLADYWITTQWTDVGYEAVRRLATYGTVFRCLAALHWESYRLPYEWVEWPVKNMVKYEAELSEAVKSAGWSA
jgi:ATP-binding cassette, subfamily B, bacterial